jgi:HSP20 family protein
MATALTTRKTQGVKTFRDEMDEMFGRFFEPREGWFGGELAVPVDLSETDNAFELRMDAPAMEATDFQVDVNGNTVTVRGERKEEKEEKGKTWHRVERRVGKFARTVTLPCNINSDEVAAEYANGVLKLTLPKAENAKPRKITVKTAAP